MKNIHTLLSEIGIEIPEDKKTEFEKALAENYKTIAEANKITAANTNDSIYSKLKDIAMNRLTDDDCKTKILEVIIDSKTGPYSAWTEDIIVKPQSYGGASGNVNIPYKIMFDGKRQQGSVTIADKVATFTLNV